MPEHNSIKIHKVLEFEDIKWLRVLQAMQDQFGIKFFEANTHLQIFWKHFREPLNLHWKKSEKLSSIENKIILALCECYSADKIEICFRRECALGSKSLGYEQRTEFSPEFDRASQSSGCQKTMFKLNIFNFHIELQSLLAVISTQITFILSAIVFYVLTVGLLLYASSVFILFTFDPLVMTGVATRNATIGLALLSFLVGLAAASNRAAINVFKVFKSYFFYKVGKYQHVG